MAELGAMERSGSGVADSRWVGLSFAGIATVEVAMMTSLILSYTWVWQKTFAGAFLVCVGLYVWIGVRSHRRGAFTEVGARDAGFAVDRAHELLDFLLHLPA